MGCAKGGIARCPQLWNLQCKNGDRVGPEYARNYWLNYKDSKCLCRDGVMPKYTQYELYGTGYMGHFFGLVENYEKIRDVTSL